MTTTGWTGSLFDIAPPTRNQEELVRGLNPAQREAVAHDEGPMLVLAGAGSGKTRVLTSRIVRLMSERGVAPHEILAVTFTNKAAGEMRARITAQLGREPRGMWCGTFHALGARMLRGVAPLVGREPNFTIYDEGDSLTACKRVMERRQVSVKQWSPNAVLAAISDAKNALVSASEYATTARDPFSQVVAGVYSDLESALERANAVTFDDLLVLPVRALQRDAALRTHYQHRFRYVLVDEYQDTNAAQYQFVALMGGGYRNVMVVGDDDQSIYGWRGADIRNILNFERDFPGARIVRLEDNYRSTPNVLALANAVIAENTERRGKTLRATRAPGEPVTLIETLDERDEAEVIADIVLERTARGSWARRDCAILYRTNAQSRALEDAFRRRMIAYRLVGAVRFYDRQEIRDLMAYLKLIANPADDEAFRRAINVPRRGLGDATVALLAERASIAGLSLLAMASQSDVLNALRPAARTSLEAFVSVVQRFRLLAADASVDELLRLLVDQIGYADHLRAEGQEGLERIENVREMIAGAAEVVADDGGEVGLTPLDHFLQKATLVTGIDRLDPDADAVTMMTMHNAKGLEFPLVVVSGLEDGLFPLARAAEDPKQLEEERRLFYVGITRAERKLYLTCAEQRRRNGEMMFSVPSRFLRAITASLAERQKSARARSEGRGGYQSRPTSGDDGWGRSSYNRGAAAGGVKRAAGPYGSASYRGTSSNGEIPFGKAPVQWSDRAARPRAPEPEDESQDAPRFAVGERVRHAKFGTGTIAELTGAGRDAKVRIDFDDDEVGRKTLVVAQAKLERGWE
ncbi:MAG: UvrD-helicase domain-containing protein [Gemmatimonadaceae bacterium]|nr:UvrD-helicase domain-containing protein [Gemmatimonadaceae bacterium]